MQNALSIHDRYDPVVDLCRAQDIPYVPYRPLDAGAAAHGGNVATALAWLLARGPHIAPIPGTGNPRHLQAIVEAVDEGGWT
ncbi:MULTISPECIES: hypothetical protein [Streptomyces]|uniref:hypothetical protein n=1 Tax=Streptomyces TaxID=1883 RepID=UPI002E2681EA|nr:MULTISPECIES: hypothetical protein [unclassified Streptomyces]